MQNNKQKEKDTEPVKIYAEIPGEPVNRGSNEMTAPVPEEKTEQVAEEKLEEDKQQAAEDTIKKEDTSGEAG
jgi:hypothetical protein